MPPEPDAGHPADDRPSNPDERVLAAYRRFRRMPRDRHLGLVAALLALAEVELADWLGRHPPDCRCPGCAHSPHDPGEVHRDLTGVRFMVANAADWVENFTPVTGDDLLKSGRPTGGDLRALADLADELDAVFAAAGPDGATTPAAVGG